MNAVVATPGALECRNVAVTVRGAAILRDLHLVVPAGALTAVVGPSGAGKTALLRAIAGLTPLADGTIRLDGSDLSRTPSHLRGLGVVFQEPRLWPTMSVADNIAFPLRMSGVRRRDRRRVAAGLLEEIGLPGIAERDVRNLSGGEQQRVALARALAGSPRLLLLDEPLSAVDPNRREDLRGLIARVQRDRVITTVYVTHDRAEAAELGDRVALLVEGRIVAEAPTKEFFTRPATPVAALFVGASNIVSGQIRAGMLHAGGVTIPVAGLDGPATVAFRPEQVRVAPDGPVTGVVVSSRFQGTHHLLTIDVGGIRLTAHAPPDRPFPLGTRLNFAIDDAHAMPDAIHDREPS